MGRTTTVGHLHGCRLEENRRNDDVRAADRTTIAAQGSTGPKRAETLHERRSDDRTVIPSRQRTNVCGRRRYRHTLSPRKEATSRITESGLITDNTLSAVYRDRVGGDRPRAFAVRPSVFPARAETGWWRDVRFYACVRQTAVAGRGEGMRRVAVVRSPVVGSGRRRRTGLVLDSERASRRRYAGRRQRRHQETRPAPETRLDHRGHRSAARGEC